MRDRLQYTLTRYWVKSDEQKLETFARHLQEVFKANDPVNKTAVPAFKEPCKFHKKKYKIKTKPRT